MVYLLVIFMIWAGYYGVTYAVSLWKEDGNRMGSIGAGAISIVGTIIPIVVIFIKR